MKPPTHSPLLADILLAMRKTGLVMALLGATVGVQAQSLDFEVYKSRVEPVFLQKRPGHARCVACHVDAATAFKLQPLPEGGGKWTEEQSRKNFETASKLVTPGNPETSRLLMHPLAAAAGGDKFHGGGRQFASQNDAEFKAIAVWVKGGK
jgi:hypothetical protein